MIYASMQIGTEATVILFRKDAVPSPRSNINQILLAQGPTTAGIKLNNSVNLAGTMTGIGINVTTAFNEQGNTGNATLSVPSVFLAGELSEFWYVDSNTAAVSITGLQNKSYVVVFAASRNMADATRMGDIEIVSGTVTSGATIQTLDAANPATGTTAGNVTFTITPASGTISFTLKRTPGNTGFAYLGGISIKPTT